MIEARVDVKTSDAYTLRLFCVGFTKKRQNQIKKTSYAQTQQVKVGRDCIGLFDGFFVCLIVDLSVL